MKTIPHVALFSALMLYVSSDNASVYGLSSPTQNTQSLQVVEVLAPGAPIERDLSGAEIHSYRITLNSGDYLRVTIAQKGVDLTVKALAPDNKQVLEVNDAVAGKSEKITLIADTPGEYRLTVRAVGLVAIPGSYEIIIEDLRKATAQDKSFVAAERAVDEGKGLRRQFQGRDAQKRDQEVRRGAAAFSRHR